MPFVMANLLNSLGGYSMEIVKITSIEGHLIKGIDENSTEMLVSKAHRIPELKIGDLVQGNLLDDEHTPDDFYIEAIQRVHKVRVGYLIQGTIDLVVPVPDLDHVENKIANDISDHVLLRGIDNDGKGIDGDQILIESIESLPGETGDTAVYYDSRRETGVLSGKVTTDVRLMEAMGDISYTAGFMAAKGKISVDDSRALMSDAMNWAVEFRVLHPEPNDYIGIIDEFSQKKLEEYYGVESVSAAEKERIEVTFTDETGAEDAPGYDVDVFDSEGERREGLTKCGLKSATEVAEYVKFLRTSYDVVILQQKVLPVFKIIDCWAVKDEETGYGDTYEDLQQALSEQKEEELIKGFCIVDEGGTLAPTFTFWTTHEAAEFEIIHNLEGVVA
jgi:hypothetical protein